MSGNLYPKDSVDIEITGVDGAGYVGFHPQSIAPSTPSSGFRLFADSVGKLAWKGINGFKRVFDGTANTADRTYTLPDTSGTVVVDATFATVNAATIHAATAKTTLVDGDEIAGTDSASSYSLIRVTMANVWAYIKSKITPNVVLDAQFASTATGAGTTTLTASSKYIQEFTGSSTQICEFPDATTMTKGQGFYVINKSTGLVTVKDNAGNRLGDLGNQVKVRYTLSANSTAAGVWDIDAGGLPIVTDTIANVKANYPYASWVGFFATVTDCNGSRWSATTSGWKPINGLFLLDVMTDPVAIIPSGTINTGSSGQCSLGSNSLDRAYPTGAWGIFPAIATTPPIAGGRVWFTCSASNTMTLYDGKNGSPISFTGSPVAFTGLTATQDLYSIAAMANLLPEGAGLRFEYSLAVTNSATGKIPQWAIGSETGLAATTFGTAVGGGASGVTWQVQNFQAQARQSYTANPYVAPASTGGTAVSVVDMTAAQTFKFSLSKSSANDMASLHYMKVWCFIP